MTSIKYSSARFPHDCRMRWAILRATSCLAALAACAMRVLMPAHALEPAVPSHPAGLVPAFERTVLRRVEMPEAAHADYARRLRDALGAAGVAIADTQYVVLVDRNAAVQLAMVWWIAADGSVGLIGAAPASTGVPAGFEHFETPAGVFEHTLANPDFRAEGTVNALGVRGYGERGRRIYDFGWVDARRAWKPGTQPMRLQLHATDPLLLEPRLGQRASKGCIRVDAGFDDFLDRYGILDAAYDEVVATGRRLWVLRPDRIATPWSGRWLVVVDSGRKQRPAWSPTPRAS